MSQDTPTIEANTRQRTGSRYAKRLRNSGRMPAVVYGHGIDPVAIDLDSKEVLRHLHHGAHVINVTINGKPETCLVKDLQFGYLGDDVIHVDFARVDLDEEVHVNVHLHFVGDPAAAQETGSVLTHDMTELEVICKVNAIPDEIVVDQSEMESVLTVADITLPPGVRAAVEEDTPIAHISFVEEAPTGEEVEIEAEGEEPEVISEAREEEEGAEGEAGGESETKEEES